MDVIFMLLESLSFIGGSLESFTNDSLINEYIFNSKQNEDKMLMLNIIIMMYISYHDDSFISTHEKRKIENYYNKNLKPFSKEYIAIINKMRRKIWTISEVSDFVKYNKIDINSLKRTFNLLETEVYTETRYKESFEKLKEALKIEEKYLRRMLSITN